MGAPKLLALFAALALATCASSGSVPTGPFYVSSSGNDLDPGTYAQPFRTLEKARDAMRRSALKTTYVRAGTYNRTSTLALTSSDNGETWAYYPPDGVNTAILDGGKTANLISFDGISNLTINGLKLQNSYSNAIDAQGTNRNNNVSIENCDIGFNQQTGAEGGFNPLVFIENATNTQIKNNYVHDAVSQGIGLYAFYAGQSIDGSVISGNVVLRTVQHVSDGGAIYINMRSTGDSGGHVTITNNVVRDYGASGILGASGIYLDDNTSHATVTGNVVGPPTEGAVGTGNLGAAAFEIHDGNSNTISGNIADLGDSGRTWAAVWYGDSASAAGMGGNTFTGNIVTSGFTGHQNTNFTGQTGYTYFENSAASNFTIQNNIYHNYAGGQVRTDGATASDGNPIFENPKLGSWTYVLASDSPAYASPVNFQPIVGGWGPPGFVIPEGTRPSSPVHPLGQRRGALGSSGRHQPLQALVCCHRSSGFGNFFDPLHQRRLPSPRRAVMIGQVDRSTGNARQVRRMLTRQPPGHHRPSRASGQASYFSADHVRQHLLVERQIGHQLFSLWFSSLLELLQPLHL